jgi:hypothetical protein
VACGAFILGAFRLLPTEFVWAQPLPRLELHQSRTADSDLEVRGLAKDGSRFVTRASLEALPQVDALVKRDQNFPDFPQNGVRVRGVDFRVLERALGVGAAPSAVEGMCTDKYGAPFPVEYVKQHRPILVLTMEGLTTKAWAAKTHTDDLGPYFVAYDNFTPAFRVFSHEDRPQFPVQMTRLEFAPERQIFAGIRPAWTTDSTVSQGYEIAQQNCFRCHSAGGYGGTKSGRSWKTLGKDARERPEWFARRVHDPQSVDAKAEMPPNPEYDRATLTALTKYFSTMK